MRRARERLGRFLTHFTLAAIESKGLGRGLWLAAVRLARCRPGRFGGYDPVPEDEPASAAAQVVESPCRS
jgi:putative component of membrane protein insertase Oxa1/YidC/SpoIIIJ protein YidD